VIPFAIVVALGTLTAGLLAALALRRLPTMRLQLAGLGLVAVALPLAAVLFSGVVMFDSEHDLDILLVAAASSTAAFGAALLVGGSILRSLDRVRGASSAIAGGDLSARAPEDGPAELAELAASFNEMAASVEELFDARTQLVAWASHDLRTPLASMQAMLEAVEDGLVEPEHYVPELQRQVTALGLLVDDLFELARLDAGVLTLDLLETPIGGVVRSALGGLEAEAQTRRVALAARIDADPPVLCAPDKVERVLLNLLTNAIRHTPSDGAVAVVVEPLDGEVRVSVEDTGDGIPPESIKRVFDHFWRGDRSRTGGGNAGLGLAIAHGLIQAQGGRIWAENRSEGGARISFTLPRAV
jgi:signal transduction histidine kinase